MNRIPWAFLPASCWTPPYRLDGDEARHLAVVLRLRPGASVRLFDGCGRTGTFAITQVLRRGAIELEPLEAPQHEPRPKGITLAPAWTKGGRRSFTVEKAVELGAAQIWIWQAKRSQGKIPNDAVAGWTRQAIAAAKQCAAPWLPTIRIMDGLDALLQASRQAPGCVVLWEEAPPHTLITATDVAPDRVVAVGPEGGLEAAEVQAMAAAGWHVRSLGRQPLRAETASLYALALAHWHGLDPHNPSLEEV